MSNKLSKFTQINKTDDWFSSLCEELKEIVATKFFNSAVEIIEGKWLIGKTIEEGLKGKEMYGEGINKKIAEIIRVSEREITRCRQFYLKTQASEFDEVISKIPLPNEKLTWHNITNYYLSDGKEKKEREYISIRIDEDNKILFIKEKYKDYRVKYY